MHTHTHTHTHTKGRVAVVEQRSTMALFTARADGGSATPAPQDFCKACVWQVMDASIDLKRPKHELIIKAQTMVEQPSNKQVEQRKKTI